MSDSIKVSRIDSTNTTRRFLTFQHMPPMKVGKEITVSDERIEVSGRLIEADWKGNHTLDTATQSKPCVPAWTYL